MLEGEVVEEGLKDGELGFEAVEVGGAEGGAVGCILAGEGGAGGKGGEAGGTCATVCHCLDDYCFNTVRELMRKRL